MVHIEVKYGLIKILQQNIDLCEQASAVDLKCPIEKGKLDLTKEVALPAQIPPVWAPQTPLATAKWEMC